MSSNQCLITHSHPLLPSIDADRFVLPTWTHHRSWRSTHRFPVSQGTATPPALILWPVDWQRLGTTRSWPLVPVSTRPVSLSRSECTGRQAYYANLWRSKPEEFLIIENFPRASPNPFSSHSEEINNIPRHMSASYLCDHRNTDASGAESLFQMSKENSNNPVASSNSFVATWTTLEFSCSII